MATFRKRAGAWRAEIARNGHRESASFDTKREAIVWATEREAMLNACGWQIMSCDKNVGDLFQRYTKTVSIKKPGHIWEERRITAFCRDNPALAAMPVNRVDASHFAAWRDKRIGEVSNGTVIREMNLFSHCFSIARDEWKWIKESPLSKMRRPKEPLARDRRISDEEIQKLLLVTDYKPGQCPQTMLARVGAAFLFAIETAMRAGEITGLQWVHTFLDRRKVRLLTTKNGDSRDVALSSKASAILNDLKPLKKELGGSVFGLTSAGLDALYRKMRAQACIEDLHFHDTRHEGITRLSKKMDVLDLARMVGIRDLRILMVYYNATAEEIAPLLD